MIKPSIRLLWIVASCFVPICALPAIVPDGERYIVWASVGLIVLGIVDLLVSRSRLEGLTVSLPPQIRGTLNQEQPFPIELRREANTNRTPATLRIALPMPAQVTSIRDDLMVSAPEPKKAVAAEMSFLGTQRGEFYLQNASLGCGSALGLWQLKRTVAAQSKVLVQPALGQISRETAKLLASKLHGGRRIVARNGRGREFAQLREFVPSDDFGDIDWKATARRRSPVVREYQVERTQDIYACIDFSRLSAREVVDKAGQRVTVLDEYIRSALMLHCAVRETGDHFGLITFSNRLTHFVKAAPPAALDHVFRKALYPLAPQKVSPAYEEVCAAIRSRTKRRALLLFFTNLSEPQLAESFAGAAHLLGRQHLIVVACLSDAYAKPLFSAGEVENVDEVYKSLSGHLLWKRLALLRFQLAAGGIRMHIASPGRLGWMVASEYLQIKERQLL